MNGSVRVSIVPPPDGKPRTGLLKSAMFRKADLARIDRVLAGAPTGYHYPKARLSRPLPADGSPPKGWTYSDAWLDSCAYCHAAAGAPHADRPHLYLTRRDMTGIGRPLRVIAGGRADDLAAAA